MGPDLRMHTACLSICYCQPSGLVAKWSSSPAHPTPVHYASYLLMELTDRMPVWLGLFCFALATISLSPSTFMVDGKGYEGWKGEHPHIDSTQSTFEQGVA